MVKRPLGESPVDTARASGAALRPVRPPAVRPGYYRGDTYQPEGSVAYLMKQSMELLSRSMEARMVDYGLTDAQWRPLLMLSRQSIDTASQVARSMGCDPGATTRMLDRLEDKGLVRRRRSRDDRRVQQLELTDQGRRLADIVPYVIADVLNAHLADFANAEVDQLRALLQRLVAAGEREARGRADAEGKS